MIHLMKDMLLIVLAVIPPIITKEEKNVRISRNDPGMILKEDIIKADIKDPKAVISVRSKEGTKDPRMVIKDLRDLMIENHHKEALIKVISVRSKVGTKDLRTIDPQGSRRPMGGRPQKPPKQLLVNKEQLAQIEELYKKMLPLPNPDAHEVIGEQIGLEARKVFFGINLIRQKMMLPKLPFPKRKLAVSPDQLTAIKMLYEPLLPLPPIGCHKIIAAQLKIDEWRVHVGIGLIRKQLGMDRWNPERPDAPDEFKQKPVQEIDNTKTENKADKSQDEPAQEEKPKKRGRKKASESAEE